MAELEKRTLGRTGVEITTLGYGAMELRGAPRGRVIPAKEAEKMLNSVLDNGINLIDTSPDYGISEELIGSYISHRRDEYFLASKCGCLLGWEPPAGWVGPGPHVFTQENITAGLEQSLRRLKTDYLDLLQVHLSPSQKEMEEHDVIGLLRKFQQDGKVRFIGMSGLLPNLPEHIEMGDFDVFQIPYSAMEREHELLISKAAASGAGIIIRGGAAKGGPSGEKESTKQGEVWGKANMESVIGDMTPMEFTIRFTASHPDMTTNIVGTVNPDHLSDNLNAARRGPLPNIVYQGAKDHLANIGTGSA